MSDNPTKYQLENIELGLTKQFKVIITGSLIEKFAELSGDYNPLHMNEEYAKSTNYKRRISHGMLLASFFSRLVGMHIPGENSLYLSQSLKFLSPCFIGDEITIEGTVVSKSTSTGIITLETKITNGLGTCLVKGESKVLVRK